MVNLAKIIGVSEVLPATPAEVATVVYSNDDVEVFTTELLAKLDAMPPTVVLTQDEYDAIPNPDPKILYRIYKVI